ncbi:MAG: hypothetical protein KDA28_05575, partial [Phycisphaerales bacterium]|nr:hypothetical protein [Phycisphaerales bacterium]
GAPVAHLEATDDGTFRLVEPESTFEGIKMAARATARDGIVRFDHFDLSLHVVQGRAPVEGLPFEDVGVPTISTRSISTSFDLDPGLSALLVVDRGPSPIVAVIRATIVE